MISRFQKCIYKTKSNKKLPEVGLRHQKLCNEMTNTHQGITSHMLLIFDVTTNLLTSCLIIVTWQPQ